MHDCTPKTQRKGKNWSRFRLSLWACKAMATIYDLVADVNNKTAQLRTNGFHRLTHNCVCAYSQRCSGNKCGEATEGWLDVCVVSTMMTVCSTEKELQKSCDITSMHFVVLQDDLSRGQVPQKQEVRTNIQDLTSTHEAVDLIRDTGRNKRTCRWLTRSLNGAELLNFF